MTFVPTTRSRSYPTLPSTSTPICHASGNALAFGVSHFAGISSPSVLSIGPFINKLNDAGPPSS